MLYQAKWTEDATANIPVGGTTFSFNVAVANAAYTVKLHFAENDHNAANQRRFDVDAEGGSNEVTNLDVYAAAGGQHKAYVRSFDVSVSDGAITLDFIRQVGQPFINAIEIVPAGGAAGASEQYRYDADGARVRRTHGSTTTFYFGGVYEEDLNPTKQRAYYALNGQMVAMREGTEITHLYNNHLGSGSVAVRQSDGQVSKQEFTPWGKVRTGGLGTTKPNYTGQKLDDTGLLFYNARYYDPALGRFISADSVVPGAPTGSMDGVALKPLTVGFHEVDFIRNVGDENRQPFWFQLNSEQQQEVGTPWGPAQAQALNRYSYVQNNPLRYTDPDGHTPLCTVPGCGAEVINHGQDPIKVQGNTYIQGCDRERLGERCYLRVEVVLLPGQSSADYGLTDVDRIRALNGNTLGGRGSEWVYEIANGTKVVIGTAGPGKSTILSDTCYGDYGYACLIGRTRRQDDDGTAEPSFFDNFPGWYTAKEKWWKNPVRLPTIIE